MYCNGAAIYHRQGISIDHCGWPAILLECGQGYSCPYETTIRIRVLYMAGRLPGTALASSGNCLSTCPFKACNAASVCPQSPCPQTWRPPVAFVSFPRRGLSRAGSRHDRLDVFDR